jgi:hypothetical protein
LDKEEDQEVSRFLHTSPTFDILLNAKRVDLKSQLKVVTPPPHFFGKTYLYGKDNDFDALTDHETTTIQPAKPQPKETLRLPSLQSHVSKQSKVHAHVMEAPGTKVQHIHEQQPMRKKKPSVQLPPLPAMATNRAVTLSLLKPLGHESNSKVHDSS